MMTPWVHILSNIQTKRQLDTFLKSRFAGVQLQTFLDGTNIHNMDVFYRRVISAVPLIEGFGYNHNALVDLFRTFGWGNYAGNHHVFSWLYPEVMLRKDPNAFLEVADSIVGVSKELLVGEELDPDFESNDEKDWVPTRLELVFACQREKESLEIKQVVSKLSESWIDEFRSLDIPVEKVKCHE